jgi:1-aminocyclopropane-1-carboxylate deaminase/D-cysteine desulfhydrase-like pyridoxal-dependent ACC family enzyme
MPGMQERPYLVPYGGSNTTGATAYVYAIQELLTQQYEPDWIVFASSSGGTQAGLVAGAKLLGFKGKVLGISVDEPADVLKERVATLATSTTDARKQSFLLKIFSFPTSILELVMVSWESPRSKLYTYLREHKGYCSIQSIQAVQPLV